MQVKVNEINMQNTILQERVRFTIYQYMKMLITMEKERRKIDIKNITMMSYITFLQKFTYLLLFIIRYIIINVNYLNKYIYILNNI